MLGHLIHGRGSAFSVPERTYPHHPRGGKCLLLKREKECVSGDTLKSIAIWSGSEGFGDRYQKTREVGVMCAKGSRINGRIFVHQGWRWDQGEVVNSPHGSKNCFEFHKSTRARLCADLWRDGVSKPSDRLWFSCVTENRGFWIVVVDWAEMCVSWRSFDCPRDGV